MLRNMEVNLMLSALLLICSWGGRAQEFIYPNVNINTELEKIKNIEERLKSQDTIVTLMKSLLEELKRENADLTKKVDKLSNGTEDLTKKVDKLSNGDEARKVAFSASLLDFETANIGPFSYVHSALIYKKIFINYGNNYNSYSGIFTAPLKGVYYFKFYAHCHAGYKMGVNLYKNNERQCSVFSDRSNTNGNAGNGIILTVEKGDQIYTKLREHSWVYDDPDSYTSFSGFLLFPL